MKSIAAKTPSTQFSVHPLITKRWSARSFSDRAIEEADLMSLFEAAGWAASSMNEQPWKYLYAYSDDPAFDIFWNCLMDGNKPWARNASVLVLSLARKSFRKNQEHNRHAMYDTGAANTNLLLQAAELDIYGHQMGGFHMEKTIADFGVSEEWEPAVFIALGYLDDPENLDEPFKSRELTPRSRMATDEFTERIR